MPPWEIKSVLDLHFLHYLHFNQSVSDSFCRHLLHLRGADIRIVTIPTATQLLHLASHEFRIADLQPMGVSFGLFSVR